MHISRNTVKKVAVGTSLVTAGAVAGYSAAPMDFTQMFMKGDINILGAIKWSSIVLLAGGALYVLIRNGVVKYEVIETGERGFRRRWGTVRESRKTGDRVVLYPGKKHFYIKGIFDIAVTSVRDRLWDPKNEILERVYRGKNVELALYLPWRVIDTAEAIYKSIFTIYELNRATEKRDTLEDYIVGNMIGVISENLNKFESDEDGLPIITLDNKKGYVPTEVLEEVNRLREFVGSEVLEPRFKSAKIAAEERLKEGLLESGSRRQASRAIALFWEFLSSRR